MVLRFGTAGIPISAKLSASTSGTIAGLQKVSELGLDAFEIEFVRGIYMKPALAREVKKLAQKLKISLTVHAPYYINLNSLDKAKLAASKKRILDSAQIGNFAGANSVTFHPAFYMKQNPKIVYNNVKKELQEIADKLKKQENKIIIAPETTGKPSQFGSLEELINLSKQIKQVQLCIDFSHLHARTAGKLNSYKEFVEILKQVKKGLGTTALKNMHMHISGIVYSQKGERHHVVLKNSDFKYKQLLQALKDMKVSGSLICESPNLEQDALMLKQTYEKL